MFEQFNFDLVVSNLVRKTSGMFIENSIKLKIKSLYKSWYYIGVV